MPYAYQNVNDGIVLLPGENRELLFTESDRRAAYQDDADGTQFSLERLKILATEGRSSQAEKLVLFVLNGSFEVTPITTDDNI